MKTKTVEEVIKDWQDQIKHDPFDKYTQFIMMKKEDIRIIINHFDEK